MKAVTRHAKQTQLGLVSSPYLRFNLVPLTPTYKYFTLFVYYTDRVKFGSIALIVVVHFRRS